MSVADYGELRTKFKHRLNRRDCTDAKADDYLTSGLRMLCRELFQIVPLEVTDTLSVSIDGEVDIPTDLLALKSLSYNDNTLTKNVLGDFQRLYGNEAVTGDPVYYTRKLDQWLLKPNPGSSATVECIYYALPTFASDASTHSILTVADEAIVAAALGFYAAIDFVDDRINGWQAAYQRELDSLRAYYLMHELSETDKAIQPATDCEY